MPRLTVMMPARNSEPTLRLAVRSTLKAMPRDSQLVVWDDGSTDGTQEVLARIRDRRLLVMSTSMTVGSGEARRLIMEGTDSLFIANMDADDVCFPWRFRLQTPRLGSADLCFASAVTFGVKVSELKLTSPFPYSAQQSKKALLFHNPFWHSTLVGHRKAIEDAGGYRSMRLAQDYDLWLRAAVSGSSMIRIGIPTVGYRRSSGQVSAGHDYSKNVRSSELLQQSYRNHFLAMTGQRLSKIGSQNEARLYCIAGEMEHLWLSKYYARILRRHKVSLL